MQQVFNYYIGACWINCHNIFDAAAGFGGYRESGFGRDGGKEVFFITYPFILAIILIHFLLAIGFEHYMFIILRVCMSM